MISYLFGNILDAQSGHLVVGVGSTQSNTQSTTHSTTHSIGVVGYAVTVPHGVIQVPHRVGSAIELFIYTHVREDQFELYGFTKKTEKELFLELMKCGGIGPKAAMGMISNAQVDEIVSAILSGDKTFLTALPGVGKKTAERIVLEIQDSVLKKVNAGVFLASSTNGDGKINVRQKSEEKHSSIYHQAKEALVSLGYREHEVDRLLEKAMRSDKDQLKLEDVIKMALKQVGL